MGQVFRAVDRLTQQTVALKRVLLHPSHTSASGRSTEDASSRELKALAEEFRILAGLRHPNIISVFDYGFDATRQPYFAMELLEGAVPILEFAATSTHAGRIDLLIQLLRALGYLHRRGILHRDIKPSNVLVLLGPTGAVVKLLDFGLSIGRDDAPRERPAGTLQYMAPELFRGAAASESSDLYSVGVIAHEILCGHHPFSALGTPAELILQILNQEPDLSLLPTKIAAVLRRTLHRSPRERQTDTGELMRDLAAAAEIALAKEPVNAWTSHLISAQFIGRDHELSMLCKHLDAARAGHGSAWLLGGESGVGKSRLLEELRSRALIEGVMVLRGQALESGGGAYHVWQDVLRVLALHVELSALELSVLSSVLPNVDELLSREVIPSPELDVQTTRFRVLRVLREVLQRSAEPVLVLLEDLQWADAESLALLRHVAEELPTLSILIIASFRDDEAPGLKAQLPMMQILRLLRLTRPAIEGLCRSMLGTTGCNVKLLDLIEKETEGNTYFIIEVVRALAEEAGSLETVGRHGVPERILAGGMERVLARRLSRLQDEARTLLRLAAVAGRQLDLAILSEAQPPLEELIQACADAGVLEVHDQRWRFSHDKLRERLLDELGSAERATLHRRIAQRIAVTYPDSSAHASQAAYHYREAQMPAEAAHYYAVAGDAALTKGGLGEAEALLEQALLLHRVVTVSLVEQIRVFRGLAQARFGLGQLTKTDAALRKVCALVGAPLPDDLLGWCLATSRHAAAHILRRGGLPRQMTDILGGTRGAAMDRELLLALSVQEVFVWLAKPELALLCTLWGLNLEGALDGDSQRTNFRAALAFLLSFTPLRAVGQRYLEQTLPTLRSGSHAEIGYLRIQSILWLNEGRWKDAAGCAEAAVACARAQKDDLSTLHCLLHLEIALTALDEYAQLIEVCGEMEVLSVRMQNTHYTSLAALGLGVAWIRLAEFSKADGVLHRAIEQLPAELGPLPEALLRGLAAVSALQQGRTAAAEELASRAMSAVTRARWTMAELRLPLCCILEVYLSAARPERYVREIESALGRLNALARRFPFAAPNALLFQGRHDWQQKKIERAYRCLRRSLEVAQRFDGRYEIAQAHFWLGRLTTCPGSASHMAAGADDHLQSALSLFEQIGAKWEAERTRVVLLEPVLSQP